MILFHDSVCRQNASLCNLQLKGAACLSDIQSAPRVQSSLVEPHLKLLRWSDILASSGNPCRMSLTEQLAIKASTMKLRTALDLFFASGTVLFLAAALKYWIR